MIGDSFCDLSPDSSWNRSAVFISFFDESSFSFLSSKEEDSCPNLVKKSSASFEGVVGITACGKAKK